MKKVYFLFLAMALLAACKKSNPGPSITGPDNGLLGKWNFVSVTTVFRDSTGSTIGTKTYPNPAGSYYQFNPDGTWGSKFLADTSLDLSNRGFFSANSDSTLTLSDTGKFAYSEKCKIYTHTPSLLLFSHSRNTMFNGVTPGTIEYLLKLTR